MRIAYADESGKNRQDPHLVVAAVIVHADSQLIPVEEHLNALIQKHIPKDKQEGFYFHATEIYHGKNNKSIFHDRNEWPDERRLAILDDLVKIPADFGLPICMNFLERATFPAAPPQKPHTNQEIEVAAHAITLAGCELSIEYWMRENTTNEVVLVTAEENSDIRKVAKEIHLMYRNKAELEKNGLGNHPYFPFVKIKDGLQFAAKSECQLLQIADVCAWAIRKRVKKDADAERYFGPLNKQIARHAFTEEELSQLDLQGF
tara:strand:- start:1788 stop:2570 length:783 start_codon:yes stop_codon:yes gene_type:complete